MEESCQILTQSYCQRSLKGQPQLHPKSLNHQSKPPSLLGRLKCLSQQNNYEDKITEKNEGEKNSLFSLYVILGLCLSVDYVSLLSLFVWMKPLVSLAHTALCTSYWNHGHGSVVKNTCDVGCEVTVDYTKLERVKRFIEGWMVSITCKLQFSRALREEFRKLEVRIYMLLHTWFDSLLVTNINQSRKMTYLWRGKLQTNLAVE